jgi:hypothetical protein
MATAHVAAASKDFVRIPAPCQSHLLHMWRAVRVTKYVGVKIGKAALVAEEERHDPNPGVDRLVGRLEPDVHEHGWVRSEQRDGVGVRRCVATFRASSSSRRCSPRRRRSGMKSAHDCRPIEKSSP